MERRFAQEQVRDYQDGELIFAEGEDSRDLYVIQEGSVVIRKKAAIGEITLAEFSRGDFFGDMALLQGIPRFAAAYAKGPTRLLILQPGGFLLKIRRDPTFAFEMLQQLSQRVKLASEKFIELASKGVVSERLIQDTLNSVEKGALDGAPQP